MPMARVKFNASADYAYLDNFKILSNAFRKHHVDRPIPVEQLVKCKMQDNLEFLQWTKRFWDQHYPGTLAFSLHIPLHTLTLCYHRW
jgi:RP/EB family microtubule-associated protein